MELLIILLLQMPAFRADIGKARLLQVMAARGIDPEAQGFEFVWCPGAGGHLIRDAWGRLRFHPLMLRKHVSRRPALRNRWTKRQATRICRMEHRRNRRSVRTFVHAAPVAPAIRAPRVLIPPW